MVELAFSFQGAVILSVFVYGVRRYGTPLNPVCLIAANAGIYGLASGIIASTRLVPSYGSDTVVATCLLNILNFLGVASPYFVPTGALTALFGRGMHLLKLDSPWLARRFSLAKYLLLLLGAGCAFLALAAVGGGGMTWLTDPRGAYTQYRAGAGPFFLGTQWLLAFALLYLLWAYRPRRVMALAGVAGLFLMFGFFTGSKGFMLGICITVLIYYHFLIKRVPFWMYLVFAPILVLAALVLLVVQGAYFELLPAVAYFGEVFDTTAQFIERFNEFDFMYGRAWLSSLWFYVPRGLYPDKPYEYGSTLIHAVLFPGAAEAGHTLGIASWALAFLDFGVLGVLLAGIPGSLLQKTVYHYFLSNRQQFFAFILAIQVSLWGILPFATSEITILLCLGFAVYLRLVWRSKSMRDTAVSGREYSARMLRQRLDP